MQIFVFLFTGCLSAYAQNRSSYLTPEITLGRDQYFSTSLGAQVGVSPTLALPISLSRSSNSFTDSSSAFSIGLDSDTHGIFTYRALFKYEAEPNDVHGLGGSLSTRARLERYWDGDLSTGLSLGIQGTRYRGASGTIITPVPSEDSGGHGGQGSSGKGRGRGDSTSTILSTSGVWQIGSWISLNQDLGQDFGANLYYQKFLYLGATPIDGNAAISDRPFVADGASVLVDGFPEWTSEIGISKTFTERLDTEASVNFTKARNTSSNVIVSPALDTSYGISSVLRIGVTLSHSINPGSTLTSIRGELDW